MLVFRWGYASITLVLVALLLRFYFANTSVVWRQHGATRRGGRRRKWRTHRGQIPSSFVAARFRPPPRICPTSLGDLKRLISQELAPSHFTEAIGTRARSTYSAMQEAPTAMVPGLCGEGPAAKDRAEVLEPAAQPARTQRRSTCMTSEAGQSLRKPVCPPLCGRAANPELHA